MAASSRTMQNLHSCSGSSLFIWKAARSFRDMLNRFVIKHLEDIRHVRMALHHLLDNGLYIKAEKWKISDGMEEFSRKMENSQQLYRSMGYYYGRKKISEWQELRWFLISANCYLHIFWGYSSVAAPLTNLMKGKLYKRF